MTQQNKQNIQNISFNIHQCIEKLTPVQYLQLYIVTWLEDAAKDAQCDDGDECENDTDSKDLFESIYLHIYEDLTFNNSLGPSQGVPTANIIQSMCHALGLS